MKRLFFINGWTLFFLLYFKATAQQVLFTSYTIQNGLVANPIRRIFQDAKGFIWIATWEGVSKYDGFKFTNFTMENGLSHNLVNDFLEIPEGLLIAENDGAVDIFTNNTLKRLFKAPSALNNFVRINHSNYVTSDKSGLFQLQQQKLNRPPQEVTGLSITSLVQLNDSLLLGPEQDQTIHIITKDLKLFSTTYMAGFNFNHLIKDSQGRIWICTSKGLKLLSPRYKKGRQISFLPLPFPFNKPEIESGSITDILENKDGSFWIASHQGLLRLEPSGKLDVYNETNGLPSPVITSLFTDRENNIWIGTALGLAKYQGKTNLRSISKGIADIQPVDKNNLLLFTSKSILLYQSNKYTFSDLLKGDDITSPGYIKGSTAPLYFYRNTILALYNNNKPRLARKIPGLVPYERSSCADQKGNSFLANSIGIAVVTTGKWYIDKTLPYRMSSVVIDSAGYLWAGSWANGLFRIKYSPKGDSLSLEPQNFTHLIGDNHIRSLFCDSQGNIWVGTRYNGVYRISWEGNRYVVRNFTKSDGLLSNFILCIAETQAHDIWIGSYLGINKLVEADNYRIFNFSSVTNVFAQVTRLVPGANKTWFCIANGNLFQFNDAELEHAPPPKMNILSVGLTTQKSREILLSTDRSARLNHLQNTLRFEFNTLSFINEKSSLHSYRLKGSNDTSWSKPQNIHEVFYASLAPGAYSFQVRSIGNNGKMGEPAVFSFIIQPPYWKTPWFYLFCIIGITAVFYFAYRYRIHQNARWRQARERIATDLHDDIGSTLTNISILTELSKNSLSHPQAAEKFLHRISEVSIQSQHALDDIIWSVNSRHDSLEEILARMRRYAADIFDNSAINCHLHLDEAIKGQKLGMEQRRDVYLIYKESLNNIYKHAATRNVWIRVKLTHHNFYMQVKDDGKGFNPDAPTHRNGLKNLKTRVEKWKGKINIVSAPGQGTNIEVIMPFEI